MNLRPEDPEALEEYFARPFDAWVLAHEQGSAPLIDLGRTPVVSRPVQAAGLADAAWRGRQRCLLAAARPPNSWSSWEEVWQAGACVQEASLSQQKDPWGTLKLPDKLLEKSPWQQFLFALRCERYRLTHEASGRVGARPPGGDVLAMALESTTRGLLPAPWLQAEIDRRMAPIWSAQKGDWSDAEVFGQPPRLPGAKHRQLRQIRADRVLSEGWYIEALSVLYEAARDPLELERGQPSDTAVFRTVAERVKESAPADALDPKHVRGYVNAYIKRHQGWFPTLDEFWCIVVKWPDLGIVGALDHWVISTGRDNSSLDMSR